MAKNHRNPCQLGLRTWSFPQYRSVGPRFFNILWNRSDIKWQDHPLVDMSFTVAYWKGCNQIRTFFVVCFSLDRTAARQCFCMYCDSLQWVTLRSPINELNNLESLYTIFGPREGDCEIITPDHWIRLHGETPLCKIIGWDPSRHQSSRWQLFFIWVAVYFINLGKKQRSWYLASPAQEYFPDYMHIMHLACSVDAICSILLDLTDGGNRDQQLSQLWESYRKWCEDARFLDSNNFFLGEPKSCLKMIRLKKSTVNYLWNLCLWALKKSKNIIPNFKKKTYICRLGSELNQFQIELHEGCLPVLF